MFICNQNKIVSKSNIEYVLRLLKFDEDYLFKLKIGHALWEFPIEEVIIALSFPATK